MASDAPESSLGYRQRTASRKGSLTGPGAPLRTADLRLCWNDARYRSTRRIETRAGFYGSYLPSAATAIATRIPKALIQAAVLSRRHSSGPLCANRVLTHCSKRHRRLSSTTLPGRRRAPTLSRIRRSEYEGIVSKLLARETLGVHHELQRIDPLTYGGTRASVGATAHTPKPIAIKTVTTAPTAAPAIINLVFMITLPMPAEPTVRGDWDHASLACMRV
jgi:hypothetical protein